MPEEFPLSAVTIMVIVGQGDARKAAHVWISNPTLQS